MKNNTYKLEATEEQLRAFIAWAWDWYRYDAVDVTDNDFRNVAQITWQLADQIRN